jgi:UDP-N-acetylglucosamine--N-acetylmuramyl-(pentapeptide) pyrophosphoryl-undecaprenol N-acetylglucosamine transferase
LAVAESLHERGHEVLLFVSEKEIDAVALKAHPQFRAEKLPSVGMPAMLLSPAFIRFVRRCWDSYRQCRSIYRKYRPSVVLGMGGFTSTAPILAARMQGLPCFIHESNAIPGRANRLAARFASRVLLGFEDCRQRFPGSDCIVTGTPVRKNLGQPMERGDAMRVFGLDPSRPTLLVTGGSQGLGLVTAQTLHQAGANVAIGFFPDEAGENRARAERAVASLGDRAMASAADVRDLAAANGWSTGPSTVLALSTSSSTTPASFATRRCGRWPLTTGRR